jgi:DNA-binding response OmpR family regulator
MTANHAPRILVVDDEPAIRSLLVRALSDEGYQAVALNDGLAGLDAALTADDPYDLVITNNCMPGLGGAELVAQLRAARPSLPIIHLDDSSRPGTAELPQDVPNLYKPFHLDTILDRVQKLLRSRR